jgi:hypothetical protein
MRNQSEPLSTAAYVTRVPGRVKINHCYGLLQVSRNPSVNAFPISTAAPPRALKRGNRGQAMLGLTEYAPPYTG